MKKKPKVRLDTQLVQQGLAENLQKARAFILTGDVQVNGQSIRHAGFQLSNSTLISLKQRSKYVSRGGDKLAGALQWFSVDVTGKLCLDVGASTGGFTDCLLKQGASRVIALDVGHSLLDSNLRNDPRVRVLEKVNVRYFDPVTLPEQPQLITVDVSFISLEKILPVLWKALRDPGEVILLVKPQFEVSPKEAPRGVVRKDRHRHEALHKIQKAAEATGFTIAGTTESSIKGRRGNMEFFLHLMKGF